MTRLTHRRPDRGAAPAWLPWSIVALLVLAALGLFLARDALLARYGFPGPAQDLPAAGTGDVPAGDTAAAGAAPAAAAVLFESVLGREPAWPAAQASCAEIEADLDRALAALAARAGEDRAALRELVDDEIARLAAARPSPTAEAGAPARLYANVVHLGRALGAERAGRLARLGGPAEEIAEPLAFTLAAHARSRASCDPDGPFADPSILYDYGVFLHGTVGGQGYVARRLPDSAALARFWSLVALGDAIAAGRNPHGIDPAPAIAVTRATIERSRFALRDAYLGELDRLAAIGHGGAGGAR